jgi:type IV pilus assembly protein PilY1
VSALANPASGKNPIKTFVIGFAVSTPTPTGSPIPVDCSKISQASSGSSAGVFDPGGLCAAADAKLAACCTLAKIAYKGGTTNAHFATDANELRSALADILSQIAGSSTSRTMPVFASGASSSSFAGSYSFFSSFVASTGSLWQGVLERQRTICTPVTVGSVTTVQPVTQSIDPDKGDDFAANVNSGDASHPRQYYTVIPDADASGKVWADRSIRPSIPVSNPDGAGTQGGTATSGDDTNFFAPKISAKAMNVAQSDCTNPAATSADDCATRFMKWEIGVKNGALPDRAGNVFGDIYHSTPALVGPPSEFLRDESYTNFAFDLQTRPLMLFGATNDGQLHAFKVDKSPADSSDTFTIDKKANNEIWSFFPPAVLPRIATQYSRAHQVLLDGAPVVKDVVFVRSAADAQSGGASSAWRTVLVAGFGAGGGGYYALDITKPIPKAGDATTGPKLLWQLTTDASGNRLFGTRTGTPAIATLYFDPAGGTDPKEYAVAILPGGQSEGPTGAQCDQKVTLPAAMVDSAYAPRSKVQCWNADPARSVTIVRLDTGEIVRTFRNDVDGPASILGRAKDANNAYATLDAPMSGQPVVFPSTTGVVSDRAFIGDRDGMLWRMDLSSANPRSWKIDLWFDAYSGGTFNGGQPIATPPILSVDNFGAVTVAFSTGDQETFLATTGMKNYLWSLKEDATASPAFKSKALWFVSYKDGERVSGPMALFASNLYYTTFTPTPLDPTKVCSAGNSKLCGVHYINPKTPDKPDSGPTPNVTISGNPSDPCTSLGENTLAFGPGITQKPSCSTDTTTSDPYIGFGTHHLLGNITAGEFDLVVHTGSSGSTANGGKTNVKTVKLATPMNTTRIDSWAGVIE